MRRRALMSVLLIGLPNAQGLLSRLWGNAFLPSRHQGVKLRSSGDPVLYLSNPPSIDAAMRRDALDGIARLNRLQHEAIGDPEIAARIAQYEMAFKMHTSVPELTDLSREPEHVFEMYGWAGYTYRWNQAQTDAVLVDSAGADEFLDDSPHVDVGENGRRKWRYPSRAECMACHTRAAGFVLGMTELQMGRARDDRGVETDQLSMFNCLGLFKSALPDKLSQTKRLVNPHDEDAPLCRSRLRMSSS